MRKFVAVCISLSALLLAGCSGGPSEGDIEKLLRAEQEKTVASMAALIGEKKAKQMAGEIHTVTKKNCAESSDNTYICEISVDMEAPLVGRKTQDAKVTLIDGDNGWIISSAE